MSKVAVIGNTARAIGAVCASDLTLSGHEVRYAVFPEQRDHWQHSPRLTFPRTPPTIPPGRSARRLKGNGVLDNVIGNLLDTTIALSHLIFEGTLDLFPRLKICSAHGGGYLASYMDRSEHGCLTFPHRCNRTLKKRPTDYLKQLYYDALIFTPEALRHLAANVGSSQIMLGTDYPYPWEDKAVDHILNTPSLSDDERIAILGETAAKLLRIQ